MGTTGAQSAAAISLTGTAVTAYSQYQAGRTNDIFATTNAAGADYQAKDALSRGKTAVARHRERVSQLLASQRVGYAAQGIRIDDGSALEVQQDTAQQAELDVLTIKNNAAMEAFGYRAQARDYRVQGKLGKIAARGEATNTLLTGVAKANAQYSADTKE